MNDNPFFQAPERRKGQNPRVRMHLKLYFDENVPEAIAAAVRLRGYDVTTVRDVEKKAASDLD